MLRYRANEWHSADGLVEIDISLKEFVDITVSCSAMVEIRGIAENGGALLKCGNGTFRFNGVLFGFEAVTITTVPKREFGFHANLKATQIGEPLDHEKAPVIPVPTSSDKLLADIQSVIRNEMREQKMSVLEPEFGDGMYDYGHEELDVFEEHEEIAKKQAVKKEAEEREAAKKKAAEEAEKKKQNEPPKEPKDGETSPVEEN